MVWDIFDWGVSFYWLPLKSISMPYRKLCWHIFFFFIESDMFLKLCSFNYTQINVMLYAINFFQECPYWKYGCTFLAYLCTIVNSFPNVEKPFNIWNQNKNFFSVLCQHYIMNRGGTLTELKNGGNESKTKQTICCAVISLPKYILKELCIAAHLID